MLGITRDVVDHRVRVLQLQRPERRNALDLDLCRAIEAGARSEVEDGARVLVVTGEGSSFCSGADLDDVYGEEFLEALYAMLHALSTLPVPVLAAVNGPAIGAGTQLALACDLRVADEAARFGVPTARNAMAVDAWTIRTLAAAVGSGAAARMMLAAEVLGRDEAQEQGLVERRGDVEVALAWARELAGLAPLALAHNKLVLRGGAESAVAASFARCWDSEDVQEARVARAQRRAPVFRGR